MRGGQSDKISRRPVNSTVGPALLSMRNIFNTIRPKWRTYLLCGGLSALITVPLVITFRYLSLHQFDSSKPQVPELKKLADQTPIYPGFQRINDDQVFLTKDTASLQRSFRTDAQSADVQKFYDSAFLKNGWEPFEAAPSSIVAGEPYAIIYNRDAYQICVCRRMSQPDVYDIWYAWAAKQRPWTARPTNHWTRAAIAFLIKSR